MLYQDKTKVEASCCTLETGQCNPGVVLKICLFKVLSIFYGYESTKVKTVACLFLYSLEK